LREIPALVKNVPDQAALAVALIENIQREDLNPLEEAKGLQRLIDEFGLTHDAAAKAVGRSRSAVSNLLRLTALAPPVQEYLLAGAIEMGHARALLALAVAQQSGAAARIVEEQLSVRDTERLVHSLLNPQARAARKAKRTIDADTARLQNELAERLGATVQIEPGRKGAGRVVIRYSTLEQLDGIVERIGAPAKANA
jgi:ParB family chromosome partitioning protein